MLYSIIALSAIENIPGISLTYFGILMFVPAFIFVYSLFKNRYVPKPFFYLLFLIPLSFLSGSGYEFKIEILLRSVQLSAIILAFCYIAVFLDVHKLGMVFLSLIYIMIAFFIWELVVKPDLLNAYLDLDLNYFITSGGTYFYSDVRDRSSGLTLFAQGNVFAAAISGSCFLVSLFFKKRTLALISFFFAISTGSRALFVTFIGLLFFIYLCKYHPRIRKLSIKIFLILLFIQPLLYLNLNYLFSEDFNNYLYS